MSCRHRERSQSAPGQAHKGAKEGEFEAEGEAYLDQLWLVGTSGRLKSADALGHRQQALSVEGDGRAAHSSTNADVHRPTWRCLWTRFGDWAAT